MDFSHPQAGHVLPIFFTDDEDQTHYGHADPADKESQLKDR
jgi:hypothetical protein